MQEMNLELPATAHVNAHARVILQAEVLGRAEPSFWGHCKSWTLDCGLDHGLDYGLRFGLHFGPLYGENESVLSQLNYCKLPWTTDGSLGD